MSETQPKAVFSRHSSNPDEIYGFTSPVYNLQKADISVVHRQEASAVLDKTVRLKKKRVETPPGTMGLIDSYEPSEPSNVQILKHGTPNLSAIRQQ